MLVRRFVLVLLLLSASSYTRSQASFELSLISMFRNEAPYLTEWLEYHTLAGVEHFWLYNNNSTDHWKEVLAPYIQQGIVEATDWPSPPTHFYVPDQVRAFRDGIRRAQGVSKWVACIDIDEFLLPLHDRSLPECLNNHFANASQVHVNWRNFGTGGVYLRPTTPMLLRLTACSLATHSDNAVGKSIVRPESVDLVHLWSPHHAPLKDNGYCVNGDGEPMSFVGTDLPTDGQHHERYIRINHYVLRDENFYKYVRLRKANRGYGNKNALLEHYNSFQETRDQALADFVRKNRGPQHNNLWKD